MFVNPWRIVPDSFGSLYVLEAVSPFGSMGAYTGIRKITPDAAVTTFAGGGAGGLPGYGTNISLGPVSWVGPLTIRAFGWQLKKADRQRGKEITRQRPPKRLEYAGEKA
jgi:hypothetical protein